MPTPPQIHWPTGTPAAATVVQTPVAYPGELTPTAPQGSKVTAPVMLEPKFCVVTVISPAAEVATVDTYLVPEPDATSQPQPPAAGSELPV